MTSPRDVSRARPLLHQEGKPACRGTRRLTGPWTPAYPARELITHPSFAIRSRGIAQAENPPQERSVQMSHAIPRRRTSPGRQPVSSVNPVERLRLHAADVGANERITRIVAALSS